MFIMARRRKFLLLFVNNKNFLILEKGSHYKKTSIMRKITLLFAGTVGITTMAQITVLPDNMPVPGTVTVYQVDTLANQSLWTSPSNTSQTWDFTTIANHLYDTTEVYDPATTGFDTSFPTAYYALPQAFAFAEVFVFFTRDTIAGTVIDSSIGMGGYLNLAPFFTGYISEQAVDGEQFIYAPLTFGDFVITNGHYKINISDGVGIDTIVHVYTDRRDSVDAFGTAITPFGTFNVIRLSGYQIFRLEVEVTGFGTFPLITDTVYRQTFLTDSQNIKMPVAMLEMNYQNGNIVRIARAIANFNNILPNAGFTASDTDVLVGEPVVFINNSSGATSFKWYFGDGDSSTVSTPQKVYNAPGAYTVTLIAYNNSGADTLTKTNYIEVWEAPVADFTYLPDTPIANIDTVYFTNLSANATSYLWKFGDGTTSTETNPKHIYPLGGNYKVWLYASNPGGTDSIMKTIVVASVDNVTSIEELGIEVRRETPNKMVILSASSKQLRIEVYSLEGKEIASVEIKGGSRIEVPVPPTPVVLVISESDSIVEKVVR